MEERRQYDREIVSRIAVVEAKLENNLEILTEIVNKHDKILYGDEGNNGLRTTVSKLRDHARTVKWVVGSLFIIVAGQVVAKFFV